MNQLKALVSFFSNLWNSLPHPLQAVVICFVTAALAEGGKIFADYPYTCISWFCAKKDLSLMVVSGLVAVRAFYMLPSHRVAQLSLIPTPPAPPESGPPAKAM